MARLPNLETAPQKRVTAPKRVGLSPGNEHILYIFRGSTKFSWDVLKRGSHSSDPSCKVRAATKV